MANEIRIPIIGEDRASRPMKDVAASADIAAAGARRLADALEAQKRAAKAAADADYSVAKANAILSVTEHKLNSERERVSQKLKSDLAAAKGPGILGRLFGAGAGIGGGAASGGGGAASGGGLLSGLLGGANPALAGGGIVAALAALPFAAQAAAGGIVTALGGGLVGIGVLAATKLKPVHNAFADLQKDASKQLSGIATPFGKALIQVLRFADRTLPQILAPLKAALTVLAPAFKTFSIDLIKAFGTPAVANAVKAVAVAFGGILKAVGPQLAGDIKDVAIGIQRIANAVSKNPGVFAAIISFFFKATGFAFSMVAALTSVANYIEKHFIPALVHIKNAWDIVRHDTAAAWDEIYNNTIGAVIRIVTAINRWFNRLPGQILGALRGLGHSLYSFARSALGDFLSGLKSVGGSIFGWVKNFFTSIPRTIMNFLHMSPPHPGSAFYDLGASFMHHLEAGMQARARKIGFGAATGGIVLGGGAGAAQRFAQNLLGRYGWGGQWAALNAVAMRESGWSTTARNPSSGAYGIAQFINGPSEYYQYGGNPNTVAGQVVGFFNYIKQRYGTPSAAWAHEQQFGWYGAGLTNGVFSKPTLIGVGERGPEVVNVTPLSGGHHGGRTVNNYITVQVGHGTHPVAAAQEIVKILNQGARNGVRLRTSILGPG